jgi:hypothetical protein
MKIQNDNELKKLSLMTQILFYVNKKHKIIYNNLIQKQKKKIIQNIVKDGKRLIFRQKILLLVVCGW